jgi:tetratricopeptide (TPR) repeat protein
VTRVGTAQYEMGRLKEAKTTLDAAEELASQHPDEGLAALAQVQSLTVSLHIDPDTAATLVEPALPGLRTTFERYSDHVGLGRVWHLQAAVSWNRARSAEAERAWMQAASHARAAGDRRQLAWSLIWLASTALWGPTPAAAGIARCQAYLDELGDIPSSRAVILLHQAGLYALTSDQTTAQDLLTCGATILNEIGSTLPLAITEPAAFVASLAGDLESAEQHLRIACQSLHDRGDHYELPTTMALLARMLVLQGPDRYAEAEELVRLSSQGGAEEDLSAQILGAGVQARILAARGNGRHAIKVGSRAVALASMTDLVNQHGDALMDLAWVLATTGEHASAIESARLALALYVRKGNRVSAMHCEGVLAELETS